MVFTVAQNRQTKALVLLFFFCEFPSNHTFSYILRGLKKGERGVFRCSTSQLDASKSYTLHL